MAHIEAVFEVKNRVTGVWVEIATASLSCVNSHTYPFDSVRFHLRDTCDGADGNYGRTEDERASALYEIEATRARVLEIGLHLAAQWRDGDSPSAELVAYGKKHGLTFTNQPRRSDRNDQAWTSHDHKACISHTEPSMLDPQQFPESGGASVPPIYDGFTNGEVETVLTLHTLVPSLRTYYSAEEVLEMARHVATDQTVASTALLFNFVNYVMWFTNANALLHRLQSGTVSDAIGDVSEALFTPPDAETAEAVRDESEPTQAMRDLLMKHSARTYSGTVRMLQRLFCPEECESSPNGSPNLTADDEVATVPAAPFACRRSVRLNYVVVATIAEFLRTDVADCRLGFRDDAGRTEHFLRCGKDAKPRRCVIM